MSESPKRFIPRGFVPSGFVPSGFIMPGGGFVDPVDSVSGVPWTVDPTSGIAVPQSNMEWSAFLTAKALATWAVPNSLYLCQEGAGNLADSIGALALTAAGGPLYQQTLNGWTRKGVGGNALGSSFRNVAAPNASTNSCLALMINGYGALDATARGVWTHGNSFSDTGLSAFLNTSNRIRYRGVGGLVDTAVGSTYNATGRPNVFRHDITNTIDRFYTDQEKMSATFAAGTSATNVGFGAIGGGTFATCVIGYCAVWFGAPAEHSDADVKSLLQAMGFSIPWS